MIDLLFCFSLIGFVFIIFGIYRLCRGFKLNKLKKRCTLNISAVCKTLEIKRCLGKELFNAVYEYEYGFRSYTGSNKVWCSKTQVTEGEMLCILIDPNDLPNGIYDPDISRKTDQLFISGMILVIIGIVYQMASYIIYMININS